MVTIQSFNFGIYVILPTNENDRCIITAVSPPSLSEQSLFVMIVVHALPNRSKAR
jgi:hypothetical protein